VITPPLPTFFIAEEIRSPILTSPFAEMVATWRGSKCTLKLEKHTNLLISNNIVTKFRVKRNNTLKN
jgi:hypothetical protein